MIDLCTPAADALVAIDGLADPVGPGSSIAAVAVVNEIKVRTAELLVARGAMPPVLTSAVGGRRRRVGPPVRRRLPRARPAAGRASLASRLSRGSASTASGASTWSMTITAAPTTPARSPAEAWTMRSWAVASGSDRRYTTSRTPASSGSPASASEPPITMTLGLSRLTALASTSPIVRPASRTQPGGQHRAAAHQRHDVVARRRRLDAGGAQPAGHRGPAGDGLEAADVAAAAHGVDVVGHLDVAEVAGRALGAAAQRAVADDAAADAGRHLDEQQVVDVAGTRWRARRAPSR